MISYVPIESYMKLSYRKHTFITCQVNYSWEKIENYHFRGHRERINQKTHGAHSLICPKTAEHLVCTKSDTILIFCTKPNIMYVHYENGLKVIDSLHGLCLLSLNMISLSSTNRWFLLLSKHKTTDTKNEGPSIPSAFLLNCLFYSLQVLLVACSTPKPKEQSVTSGQHCGAQGLPGNCDPLVP